jgi:anti-anti-sigma factor
VIEDATDRRVIGFMSGDQQDRTSYARSSSSIRPISSTTTNSSAADARADPLPPAFACTATHGGLDAAWVYVVGELDIATAPELERTLRESQQLAHLTVLDLRELVFMDSAGAHSIVNASLRARRDGRRLVLCAAARTSIACSR